jgi:hypothetical protein
MSMFGANFEICAKCNSDVDAYDKKCTNCGATDFKRSLKYCELCSSPAEMTEFECKGCGGSSFVHGKPNVEYCPCPVPLIQGEDCARCNKPLSPARLNQLRPPTVIKPPEPPEGIIEPPIFAPNRPAKGFEDLIEAQNRTTHAVRAFVRFLFIQLSGLTLAVFIWNISNLFIDQQECFNYGRQCSGNGFFRFLAVVIGFITIYWSSDAGWKELEKSKIN